MFISMAKSARTRDPEAKEAALHRSAFQLLSRSRYEDLPVSEIARNAGVAVGTFYRFYPTKMALLEAMSDALEQEFVSAMRAAWSSTDDYEKKLDALSAALFDVIRERKEQIVVMQMTAGHRSGDSKPMGYEIREEIADLFREGVCAGKYEAHDPLLFAAVAHGSVEGLMVQYLIDPVRHQHNMMVSFASNALKKLALSS